jgi:hypothetical protein
MGPPLTQPSCGGPITPLYINYTSDGFTAKLIGTPPLTLVQPTGGYQGTVSVDSGVILTASVFSCGSNNTIKYIDSGGCEYGFGYNIPACPTDTCTTTDITSTYSSKMVYKTNEFTCEVPNAITAQAGNDYVTEILSGTPKKIKVTGIPCGSAGMVQMTDAEGCIYQLSYVMPVCDGQTVAAPVNFTIDKLTCKSFEVSWGYGIGKVPKNISCMVYNGTTGAILYDNTAWSNVNTTLNSIDLGITVSPLETIAVKISTGPGPILLLFSDFYIPECQTGDCSKKEHERNILPILFLFIALIIVIYLLLRQLIPNTFSV